MLSIVCVCCWLLCSEFCEPAFFVWFCNLCFEQAEKNFEHVILPEVSLCSWWGVKIQELTAMSRTLFRTCIQQTQSEHLDKSIQSNMMLYIHWQWYFNKNPSHIQLKFCLPCLLQNYVQAQQIAALLSVSSSLGPSTAINIFHQCLVLALCWYWHITGWFLYLLLE